MPRPMQHPRQAPRGTVCNVACGTLLPPSTSHKHAPVTVGAQMHLGPGHEATERGLGMGQPPGSPWPGQRRHGKRAPGFRQQHGGQGVRTAAGSEQGHYRPLKPGQDNG